MSIEMVSTGMAGSNAAHAIVVQDTKWQRNQV
jgi:hypothetical protein